MAMLKESFLPPTAVVATSETLLKCCPPQGANTAHPLKVLCGLVKGCTATAPSPDSAQLRRQPHPQTLVSLCTEGCDTDATPCAALLKASGGFKVLAVSGLVLSSRDQRCHLGMHPLPTWGSWGVFDGSDPSFEEKQMMFCNCCCRAASFPVLSHWRRLRW